MVSQSIVVLHFFDSWGTDIRTYNQQSTEVVGVHGLGRYYSCCFSQGSCRSLNSLKSVGI